jgi:hypothetical protein
MQADSCTQTRKAIVTDICTKETMELKVSCRISTRGMEVWSTILNINPSFNRWNRAMRYPQGIRNPRVRCQLKKKLVIVFWDKEGVILVIFLSRETTVKSDHHIETLRILNPRLCRVPPTTQSLKYCFSTTKLSLTQVWAPKRPS